MRKKKSASLSLAIFAGILLAFLFAGSAFGLSNAEADAIVRKEAEVQAEREADRRNELLEMPAVREWTVDRAGQRTIFRQVAPPTRKASTATEETGATEAATGDAPPSHPERKSMNLTFFVTVFDDEITEIRVAPLDDGVTVLSNVPFTYLPAIESLTEDVYYSFFSFVNKVESDSTNEANRPDPTIFSSSSPEYVVFSKFETEVSPDLLEAIDALHRHYLQNEADFEARAQRAEALRMAREQYLEENPPPPQETVINFFPIRSRTHSQDNN